MFKTSDKLAVFELLGVVPGGIGVRQINVVRWGANIEFECFYDFDAPRDFLLSFEGCQNVQWSSRVKDEMLQTDLEVVDVIDITLGESEYQTDAVIHTDLFEIIIAYRSLSVRWKD